MDLRAAAGLRVVLRPVTAADLPLLLQWQNDHEIARWMDYRTRFSLADIRTDQRRAAAEGHPFVISYEDRPIGKGGLNRLRPGSRSCSLYVYIGEKPLWGRGLGRDAVMALLRFAFDELSLENVELTMIRGNERARRAYEACGFRRDPARSEDEAGPRPGRPPLEVMVVDRGTFERARSGYGI